MPRFRIQSNLHLDGFQMLDACLENVTSFEGLDDKNLGRIVFLNGSSSNQSNLHPAVYDGLGFKGLAYLDDIEAITNGEGSLGTRVKALEDMLGLEDVTDVIDTWNDVKEFFANVDEGLNLMTMLDGKLDKTGGTMTGNLVMDKSAIRFISASSGGYLGFSDTKGFLVTDNTWSVEYPLIHSGNALDELKGTFLPLTGGTMELPYLGSLKINCGYSDYKYSFIEYRNNGENLGRLGFGDVNTPVFMTAAGTPYVLLHESNVGDYALKKGLYFHLDEALNIAGYSGPDQGWGYNGAAMVIGYSIDYRWALQAYYSSNTNSHKIRSRYYINNNWDNWKTIAFTDSDITGNAATATKLKTAVSLWGNTFDGTRSLNNKITLANRHSIAWEPNNGAANIEALVLNDGNNFLIGQGVAKAGGNTLIYGNNIKFCYGTAGTSASTAMTINSYGNISIGDSDRAGENIKLFVNGPVQIAAGDIRLGNFCTIRSYKSDQLTLNTLIALTDKDLLVINQDGDVPTYIRGGNVGIGALDPQYKLDVYGDGRFTGLITASGGALIPTGQKLTLGDANGDHATIEYDSIAKAIKVDGNLFTTGTNASGGKADAQQGGTGGNAEVYEYTLDWGTDHYEIINPKGSTNVIVQVYEWNDNDGAWDIIQTDVSVNESYIFVTFGKKTSVDHLVTVV